MRRFKAAVVAANAPRGLTAATGLDPLRRTVLREHRMAHSAEVESLKDRLTSLDCRFLVGESRCYQVCESDWEKNIWRPLHHWVVAGYDTLYAGSQGEDWPTCVPLTVFHKWEQEEQEIEWMLMEKMTTFLPDDGYQPVLNDREHSVRWRGQVCPLGDNNSFRLMSLLVKGRRVSRQEIVLALFGDVNTTDDALRQCVSRLRKCLRKGKLSKVAESIIAKDLLRNSGYIQLDLIALNRDFGDSLS